VLTVELGDDKYELDEGDYIAFEGSTPHRVVNNGESVARAYWLVVHKERQDLKGGG
jgi:quercetin dioxygenase-like cupin family protein